MIPAGNATSTKTFFSRMSSSPSSERNDRKNDAAVEPQSSRSTGATIASMYADSGDPGRDVDSPVEPECRAPFVNHEGDPIAEVEHVEDSSR